MPKDIKGTISKKASSKVIEEPPWREQSFAINFNDGTTLRTCDVVLMVESEEACFDAVYSCYLGYKLNPIAAVKIITYTDLKMEIIEYVNNNDIPDKDKLFEKACVEAVLEMKDEDTIPIEVLAHIIKLKIINTIIEDVRMEQEQLFLQTVKESEYKKLFESSKQGTGDGKKKKRKDKPAKEAKKKATGKKKKGAGADDEMKITSNPPKPFSQFYKGGEHPEIQVEDKHLYIILTGFYSPELIAELVKVGVPLTCLLEISFSSESTLYKEDVSGDTEVGTESSSSRGQTISTLSSVHSGTSSRKEKIVLDEAKVAEVSFKTFWEQVINLMHMEEQHSYLNDIFHMFYKAAQYSQPEAIGESGDWCNDVYERHFEDLSEHIKEIETLKRQHTNYIRNLKLQKIPCVPILLQPHCLRIYNKIMKKFPSDCFSIPLLMACLLEEVCAEVGENPVQTDILISKKNTEENPLDNVDIKTNPETESHGGVRDQVVNVLECYKKRHDSLDSNNINKHRFRCYTCKYDPKIDLSIDSKSFMVHANNELQIIMNCYKRLSKELYAINVNGLKKYKAGILRSRHAVESVLEKLINEYNLQSWRNALGMTKDELCDAIHIFLLTKLKDKPECNSSNNEIDELQLYPSVTESMLFNRFSTKIDEYFDYIVETDFSLLGQISSLGMLYRNISKDMSEILHPANPNKYCYKEYLPGPVLLQELSKAGLEYECVDSLYSPLTDTLLLLFHDKLNDFGCANMFKKEFIRTPVCIRDFCQYVMQTEKEWLEDQEFYYQTAYKKQVEELKRKKEELRQALYSEFIPEEFYFILPDSIKAKLLAKDEPPPPKKGSGKKKGGKEDKKSGSEGDKKETKKKKKKDKDSSSSKKSETQLDIEDVLKKMPEVPPKKVLSLHCAEDNQPYSFIAYDLGASQVQINGWTSVFHSLDGVKVIVNRTCWLGSQAAVAVNLINKGHSFTFHYRPDLVVSEPLMFHTILSDGTCLVFSKPVKFQKIEDAICERICHSRPSRSKASQENSAYVQKPQEIYFVSEKQDCVIKSLKVPFSTERNLVLSENLLAPFLNSLEKFNIRAHVTVPSETLRQRQKRRHNLQNRITTSASATRTTLSKYASKHRGASTSSRAAMVERYSPKVIVHKTPKMSAIQVDHNDFLYHSYDDKKFNTIPQSSELYNKNEILQKLKVAFEKHVPLFKICSSRLHKFAYVKRVKSYINIPVGNVIKRILYKPAYYKSKRTIEIKRCLPLGCVNAENFIEPTYNVRMSLPSGLVIRDIPGVASEFPCIQQYYIDKGPQCKDIVHEESRTFLRNGNIAIKLCDGNINVLSANGRIFHFEVPYIMKTKTERLNYHDTKVANLKKNRPLGVPIHAAKKSLTTFQKLLHKVLPRRFKHMIDSKESRYYLSRRAYLRAQKKYCTNINSLYLLESQRQPFPEYTVITPDGKKIKVSNSKVYEEQKFYVATDIDYRMEETLYEREDGTSCILNRDGVLVTQFPDGTRLTTWFEESSNLVFADEIISFNTKDEYIQADDVSNMNISRKFTAFDVDVITLDPGFVSIHMYYEYKHPNYATVIFGGEESEMKIILPNDTVIASKEGDKTKVVIGKHLETEFNKEKFSMKVRNCDNCANSCHALVDLSLWYEGLLPLYKTDSFVHVTDSFEKHFKVDFDGRCTRNPTEKIKTETECVRHIVPTLEKVFSVKSDFSGCLFWSEANFEAQMDFVEKNVNCTVDTYGIRDDESGVVDFKKYVSKPYQENYLCKYEEPTLKLTKYKAKQGKFPDNPAYILQNILHKVISISKLEPLYKCILENCEKRGLRKECENFELFFSHVTQKLPAVHRSIKHDDRECLDPCPCNVKKGKEKTKVVDPDKEEMRRVQDLHDKWYKWQQECKKYKKLLKENYVPLYFKSKFVCKSNEESKGGSEKLTSSINRKSKEIVETAEETESEETHISSTSDVLQEKTEDIKVQKKKSVENKLAKGGNKKEKIIRESLRVTIPKNMVLLYNQRKGDKSLEVGHNKITARSESTGGHSENGPEKMLILAGVRNSSKVEIANRFLEIHGGVKTFEDGSKVVIVGEGTKPQAVNSLPKKVVDNKLQNVQQTVPINQENKTLNDKKTVVNDSNAIMAEKTKPPIGTVMPENTIGNKLQSAQHTLPIKQKNNTLNDKEISVNTKENLRVEAADETKLQSMPEETLFNKLPNNQTTAHINQVNRAIDNAGQGCFKVAAEETEPQSDHLISKENAINKLNTIQQVDEENNISAGIMNPINDDSKDAGNDVINISQQLVKRDPLETNIQSAKVGKTKVNGVIESKQETKTTRLVEADNQLVQAQSNEFLATKGDPNPTVVSLETANIVPDATSTEDTEEYQSASDVLKGIVMISQDLNKISLEDQTSSTVTSDDSHVNSTKRKVMSILSKLMRIVIDELSKCPQNITKKMSNAITTTAYHFICSSNLNKKEMGMFLKALKEIVDEALDNTESHVNMSSDDSSYSELLNKSKIIPVKHIGDVFDSYNKDLHKKRAEKYSDLSDSEPKKVSSVNEVYLNENTLSQKSTAADHLEENTTISEDTMSYQGLEISGSMIGFTSKHNFRRFSKGYEKDINTEYNARSRISSIRSAPDFEKSGKGDSVGAPSRVKFQKVDSDASITVNTLNQSDIASLESQRIRMAGSHQKHKTPSLVPLYSSSINMRQPADFFNSHEMLLNVESDPVSQVPLPEGRFVTSEGTQTYTGKDKKIQTPNELLADEWLSD